MSIQQLLLDLLEERSANFMKGALLPLNLSAKLTSILHEGILGQEGFLATTHKAMNDPSFGQPSSSIKNAYVGLVMLGCVCITSAFFLNRNPRPAQPPLPPMIQNNAMMMPEGPARGRGKAGS